jgi:hypothetical protein
MNNWIAIIKKFQTALLDQPLLASIFITDFAILLFHSPPIIFSLIMVGGLVAMSMYFGQKLAFFKIAPNAEPKPQAVAAAVVAETAKVAASTTTKAAAEAVKAETTPKAKAKPKAKPKA